MVAVSVLINADRDFSINKFDINVLDILQVPWLSVRRVDRAASVRRVGDRRAGLHVSQFL